MPKKAPRASRKPTGRKSDAEADLSSQEGGLVWPRVRDGKFLPRSSWLSHFLHLPKLPWIWQIGASGAARVIPLGLERDDGHRPSHRCILFYVSSDFLVLLPISFRKPLSLSRFCCLLPFTSLFSCLVSISCLTSSTLHLSRKFGKYLPKIRIPCRIPCRISCKF